jgi:hypothetical protein
LLSKQNLINFRLSWRYCGRNFPPLAGVEFHLTKLMSRLLADKQGFSLRDSFGRVPPACRKKYKLAANPEKFVFIYKKSDIWDSKF